MITQLLDNRTVQRFLATKNLYSGANDGVLGPASQAAMNKLLLALAVDFGSWDKPRRRVAVDQIILSTLGFSTGSHDGLVGPRTLDALERYQNSVQDREPLLESVSHLPTRWPRERDMGEFYGSVGQNCVSLKLPYRMRLAWDLSKSVTSIQCHEKVHDSLGTIFSNVLKEYGETQIRELGLDLFGGCLNVRSKKGGRSYSTHSWAAAIDLDPENNQFRWGRNKARLARVEYEPFWKIVESEGWVSLGREKNFDWMHFQAARF